VKDARKDLLVKIKQARLAGYKPKKEEVSTCIDLHRQEFIGHERVLSAGIGADNEESIFYRYYIKPKGHRYVGVYGSSVPDILYRGGSCPVGIDRHGRTCSHEGGVFLSSSKEVATYYATRFNKTHPVIEECMIGVHSTMTMDGKGWTSPELGLNQARQRYVNTYDSVKVLAMHMGHLDDNHNRFLTEEHKEYDVPEICDVYIVFNAWDVYPLSEHQSTTSQELEDNVAANDGFKSLTVPKIAHN